ncbi:MAG TPA: AMP-binding protein [Chloroflexia bacterium]|nr:AMP-binding protein [Chloroflexia bacterium]
MPDAANDSTSESIYDTRPWTSLYPDYVPQEISPRFNNGLDMFLAAARSNPDRPAVYYFDHSLTYADLDRQSTALAVALRANGIERGDRVALYLQNIPQFLITLYATWKAGGIAVLCNPMFKHKELEYHLKDSGAKALVCLETLYANVAKEVVPATAVRFVVTTSELDYLGTADIPDMLKTSQKQLFDTTSDLLQLVNQYRDAKFEYFRFNPEDVAFLTYTSGTTGRPKGAMNTHGNLVYNATFFQLWMQLDERDVVVGVAPFFHITGLVAHIAIAALAALPIITFYRFDAPEMLRLVEKWRGSFTVAAITAYIALLNHPAIKKADLSSFKKLYSGGAPVSPAFVEAFQEQTGSYIHNIYGLTETTSPSHAVPFGMEAPVDPESGALSVGLPIPGTLCRIIDVNSGADLPPGEVGELLTKGPQVVPGYWEKFEESANAISDGYLHTGDVAKMDQAGWFYLVDRKKDMIIASGYKVWPREVEDVLYQHPAVREAGVIGLPDPYRGQTVMAYVALKSEYEGKVTPRELIEFCKERMANYKYPRQIEFMPELPKTATGKFLRRELLQKAQAEKINNHKQS